MNRTIEQKFRTSYHVGTHYEQFKILIVTKGGCDFSLTNRENGKLFRDFLNRNYGRILNAFDEAANEVGISLSRIARAEFFTTYNYYWYKSDEKMYRNFYLNHLIGELDANLVLLADVSLEDITHESDRLSLLKFLRIVKILKLFLLSICVLVNRSWTRHLTIFLKG